MRNRYSILWLWILLVPFVAALKGCDDSPCLHGNGETTSIIFPTTTCDSMIVNGLFHVRLIEDTASYVEFVGDEKALEHVDVRLVDSCLWLENANTCSFIHGYEHIRADVHFRTLPLIHIFHPAKIETTEPISSLHFMTVMCEMCEIDIELNTERFGFYNHVVTSGIYTFSGYADRCWIQVFYNPQCNFGDLTARTYSVVNASVSDFHVNALERLKVEIRNSGNVYYSGSPEIEIDTLYGTGRLLPWVE